MIGKPGLHLHLSDTEAQLFEFLDLNVGRHLAKANREKRALHLAGQDTIQAMASAFIAKDAQMVLRLIHGQKKRQPLDVIPMGVRQQQSEIQGPAIEFR